MLFSKKKKESGALVLHFTKRKKDRKLALSNGFFNLAFFLSLDAGEGSLIKKLKLAEKGLVLSNLYLKA